MPTPANVIVPSERFLQAVLPMAMVSLDGVLLHVNDAACRLVGRPREELVGAHAVDVVSDEACAAVREALDAVSGGEAGGELEAQLPRPDGDVVLAQVVWSLMRHESGAPWYLTAALFDVTDARREHEELRQVTARFRARFEQSSVPQVRIALDGSLISVNAAFGRLVGRDPHRLAGLPPDGTLHPHADGGGDAEMRQLLTGEVDNVRFERVLADADGRPLPVWVDATLVRDPEGRSLEAGAFVYDLRTLRDVERRREQQEQFFLAVSQHASDVSLVADADGQLLFVSAATQNVAGYDPHELVAQIGWEFVHPDDLEAAQQVYRRVVESGGTGTFTVRIRVADGSWRWFEETVTNMLDTAVGGIVANLRDIHERVEAERALRASEARYRTIADTAEEGMWVVAPDGTTLYANAQMASILGVELDELEERSALDLLPDEAERMARRLRERAVLGPERYEVSYRHPDGAQRRLWIAASPLPGPDGESIGSLKMVSDVTDARQAEAQLRRAALHDALTGLPNRTLLSDRLEQAIARRDATEAGDTALLLLDLDGFKLVNDSRGHGVGDSLLVAVAERLQAHARPRDTVARLGGDEFVLVCEDVDEATAQRLADDLLEALRVPFEVDGQSLHVSASVGIAVSPGAGAEDLLRFADAAMYAAKGAGRGRTAMFDRALADEAERRHALSADLRAALSDDRLELHYQPLVDLATGRVVEIEALARWRHPRLGEVEPTVFVPVAEQTGLSGPLNDWALRRAVHDLAGLRDRALVDAELRVSVNLSVRSLGDPGLEEHILAAVEQAGLTASAVTLEITESAIMADAERAVRLLSRLRERGFGIAVDDFGTGYSSLAYLRDLPITSLKIDRSFVAGIVDDRDALAIVASIVDLARAIDVRVVAEGVETAEQAAVLRKLGCAMAQGWLWSPALSVEQIAQVATTWRSGYAVGPPRAPRAPKQPERWDVLPEHGLDRLLALHREGASLTTIAAALNSEGFRAPSGARWHRTTVARTIAAQAYPELASQP